MAKRNKTTVSEQTTAVETVKPEVVRVATEKEAKASLAALKAQYRKMRSEWFELGSAVRDALDRQVPAALGMSAMDFLREAFDESAAKIYRSLRIVKALAGVPQEAMKQLTEGKAYQLTRLPEKLRTSEEWVGRALKLNNDDFERSVDAQIGMMTGIPVESRVTVSVTLEESVAEHWKAAEGKIAEVLQIDIETKPGNRAQVFEGLAALVNTTEFEVLKAAMVGADAPAPS